MTSSQVALQVAQQAISVLAKWADANLPSGYQLSAESHPAVVRAKKILSWHDSKGLDCLRLLFDAVKLTDSKVQDRHNYHPASQIADYEPAIPYPQKQPPTLEEQTSLKQQVKQTLEGLAGEDWQNLSLLMLIIEKFGSCLSFGEPDVALIDMVRATAAVAAALVHYPEADELSLIAGDLSGIQKFIYTISSDGALKSLRARSFYLELVTEEIVQQLLAVLELPRTSAIYAGGGKLYLLAAATDETKKKVDRVHQQFNEWLRSEFQSKVFLALDYLSFKASDVANQEIANHWNTMSRKLNEQKSQKFVRHIDQLLKPRESYDDRCRVCHRDDTPDLEQLNPGEDDSVLACPTCRNMFQLGSQLFKAKAFLRSFRDDVPGKLGRLSVKSTYYYLFESKDKIHKFQTNETIFFLNNWTVDDYRAHNYVPLVLGNYGQKSSNEEEPNFIRAIEMANRAEGIKRVGYLRMDVDNLGKIFARGLNANQNLPKLAGLSRQMSYFFKVYLNSLAKNRKDNFLQYEFNDNFKGKFKFMTTAPRQDLLFIYAGGDDLFVSGAWNQVVEFAFDVYQSFRAFTGGNPNITLSGGISIGIVKYPLYQAAEESGEAENAAKSNGRDSLCLFGKAFKWGEWLGTARVEDIDEKAKKYLNLAEPPELFGVWEFVKQLRGELADSYARSFVRNLLATAQIQEQKIREKQRLIDDIRKKQSRQTQDDSAIEKMNDEQEEIRYYLHLPKIAYTLARLPRHLQQKDSPFKPVRTSLKSPYNAPYFRAVATWIELLTRPLNP